MTIKKALIVLSIFICAITLNIAFAAEEHAATNEHAAGEEHHESLASIIGKWVNFLVLVGLLYYFLAKKMQVPDRFKEDYEKIQSSIESARIAKEEAEKKLAELDQKLSKLNDEIVRLKTAAAKEADEEKKKILEAAQKEAERIVEQAHRDIDSEVENARKELRKQLADQAVSRSREIIERELSDQDQKRLISDYIERFGK
ncbi:F0F1 ATP synthase subunit B [bacterium]|nr:F0F1 ATP synthase subunit B [bacterium]